MRHGLSAGKFVARDQEQERALVAVLTGRGTAIVGPAGVGKTALVSTVTRQLNTSRFAVVWIVATEASRTVPFGVFTQLLDANDSSDPTLAYRRLTKELTRRADGRTPVLVIDDAHYLDSWSASFALGLAGDTDVRLMVTAQSAAQMPDPVVALWKDGYLSRLDMAPFDHGGTAELVRAILDGEVARPTARLLYQWTGGNPLLLTELVRHGRAAGCMLLAGGLWWWRGPLAVPPRLTELFDRQLHGLDARQQDAVAAVALGEPVPLPALEAVAPDVIESLEDRGLLLSTDGNGQIRVRLRQPMLGAALRCQLPRLRRRRIATALLDASEPLPAGAPDLATRARWALDAGSPVDARLLIQAADATYQHDPDLAYRMASRAMERSDAAAVPVANALVELGATAQARLVLEHAHHAAGTAGARLRSGIALAAHRCWVDRDPSGAHDDLLALRCTATSPTARATLDGVDALVLLFSGRAGEALRVAEPVVLGSHRGTALARLALAASLALMGRTADAVDTATALTASSGVLSPSYVPGTAAALVAFTQLWHTVGAHIPSSDLLFGRWPQAPDGHAAFRFTENGRQGTEWPLLAGYGLMLAGDRHSAIARLREAVVQQSGGQRLFRTEAVTWLVVCLAEQRRPHEAEQTLTTCRPDGVAVIPGHPLWANATIAAARGDLPTAVASMDAAIAAARAAGCWSVELEYLTYAHWFTAESTPDRVLDRISVAVRHVDAPRLVAGAEAALAARRGDGAEILGHAIRLDAIGMSRPACRLADVAVSLLTEQSGTRRAEAVMLAGRLRHSFGTSAPATDRHTAPLTAREVEIAALAAAGLPDREIARRLSLSARTVQSHLSRIYRKLGVHSRHELPSGGCDR